MVVLKKTFDAKTDGKIRQFYRLLISYNDFKQAADIAAYILEKNLHNRKKGESRMLLEALNCAMVVAYCRSFSGNDGSAQPNVPDLPKRFLRTLTSDERELHEEVIKDRNTVLAHSDSKAWNLRPTRLEFEGRKILFPISSDTRAPLTREATERLHQLSRKLREAVFEERMKWEPDLIEYFDAISEEAKREFLRGVEAARKHFPDE